MSQYEYKVVAAPTRGVKAKGVKTPEARFSHALEQVMNEMAAEGWSYMRAETLPSVERSGLTSTTTMWRNVLVFRRLIAPDEDSRTPVERLELPLEPVLSAPAADKTPDIVAPQTPDDDASRSEGASRMLQDNGVEEVSEVSGMTDSLKQLAASRTPDKPES